MFTRNLFPLLVLTLNFDRPSFTVNEGAAAVQVCVLISSNTILNRSVFVTIETINGTAQGLASLCTCSFSNHINFIFMKHSNG